MSKYDAVIIGAGLAGLTCGAYLARAGKKVLLLESRNVIGGRTSSWNENGMYIESGLHRFLGFFEHLPELINDIGSNVDDVVVWEDEIEIHMPEGEPSAVFGLAPLFKPVETIKSVIVNNDFLPPVEKLKIAKFFASGFLLLKTDPQKLDKFTVASYAKEHGLSADTLRRALTPMTEGLFFLSPQKYSAFHFFSLFAPYLTKMQKARVGAFRSGMTEIMAIPIAKFIQKNLGELRTGSKVERLEIDNNKVQAVTIAGKQIKAQEIVLATSLASAQNLLKKSRISGKSFEKMYKLQSMPAVTFQLELKEPAMDIDRTTFSPGTVFAAYSEQSRTTFTTSSGRLSIILASPEKYLKTEPEKILKIVLEDAKRLNINLPAKNVKSYRKVTWEKDFYSYERGTDPLRPDQKTAVAGLTLAGDYTRQKYLSTMEGAVYSGKIAALNILNGS